MRTHTTCASTRRALAFWRGWQPSSAHGSLLAAGLVDAVVRYEAPILLGGGRAACAGPSFASPQMALQLTMPEERGWGAELRRAFLVAPSEGENAR